MPTVEQTLNIARSKLGYYAPGPPRHSMFGDWAFGMAGPYCDAFVSWVFDQAGFTDFGKQGYCPATVNYWRNRGRLFTNPVTGDQVIYFWNGQYAHTGIVEHVDGDRITVIEGNTSEGPTDPNGGKVLRKIRLNAPRTVYGRPEYSAAPAAPAGVPFAFSPPLVMRPIVAEWSPVEGGAILVGDNGDAYAMAGAQYPGHLDVATLPVAAHAPLTLEPIVDARRGSGGEGGAQLLSASGAVYAIAGAGYHGGPNMGHDGYFKGLLAARFEDHPSDPAAYCVRSTVADPTGPAGLYCAPFG